MSVKKVPDLTPLMLAAETGDVEKLRNLLDSGVDANVQNRYGKTALIYASLSTGSNESAEKCARLLINSGAKVEMVNYSRNQAGKTALMHAIKKSRLGLVEVLLQAGANVNLPIDTAETPLTVACSISKTEILERLIQAGADVNQAGINGNRPILVAAARVNLEALQCLIKNGADVNTTHDKTGMSCLMICVKMSCIFHHFGSGKALNCMKLLIDSGARINAVNSFNRGFTPLLHAANGNRDDILEFLVKSGADVNIASEDGCTSLYFAVESGSTTAVSCLLSAGAEVKDELHQAIRKVRSHILQTMIKHGVMPSLVSSSALDLDIGLTEVSPLLVALLYNNIPIIKFLLNIWYLTRFDITVLLQQNDLHHRLVLAQINHPNRSIDHLINIFSNPRSLVTLSFVTVSTSLGFGPGREDRVKVTGLPIVFQEKLMFRDKLVDTPVSMWDSLEI